MPLKLFGLLLLDRHFPKPTTPAIAIAKSPARHSPVFGAWTFDGLARGFVGALRNTHGID